MGKGGRGLRGLQLVEQVLGLQLSCLTREHWRSRLPPWQWPCSRPCLWELCPVTPAGQRKRVVCLRNPSQPAVERCHASCQRLPQNMYSMQCKLTLLHGQILQEEIILAGHTVTAVIHDCAHCQLMSELQLVCLRCVRRCVQQSVGNFHAATLVCLYSRPVGTSMSPACRAGWHMPASVAWPMPHGCLADGKQPHAGRKSPGPFWIFFIGTQ